MTILDKIVDKKHSEIELLKREGIPYPPAEPGPRRNFKEALIAHQGVSIIAEAKKASPSKGLLCPEFDPVAIAKDYEQAGASAVSVLTDEHFFQGSLRYLFQVRSNTCLPVLRKDFIVDHIQVEEADRWGADAILLIVAILEQGQLSDLWEDSKSRGMDVLVEIHDEDEAETALSVGVDLIGINNRNLKDFSVSINTTVRLRQVIPADIPVVSESGIKGYKDIEKLAANHVDAVLIGESLVTARDRKAKLEEFLLGQTG